MANDRSFGGSRCADSALRGLCGGAFLVLAVLGVACSFVRDQTSSQNRNLPDMTCVEEWRNVLEEWEATSPIARESLGEIQKDLLDRPSLKLAKFLRTSWSLQDPKIPRRHRLTREGWPVADEWSRSLIATLPAAANGIVSKKCERSAPYVLPALLGEEVVSQRPSSPLREVDVSRVDATRKDATLIGNWLFIWLISDLSKFD